MVGGQGSYLLRESPIPYHGILRDENDALRAENIYFWDYHVYISGG